MSQPLLTIIIPFFNTGESLKQLLAKIQKCGTQDKEIICVDDCSTDNSYEIIKQIKNNSIVLLKTKKNSGASAARNLALKKANGKYLIFLDSDDDVDSSFFKKMIGAINKDDYALAVCGIKQQYLHSSKDSVDKFTNEAQERQGNMSWKEYILSLMIADGRLYSCVNKIYLGDVIRNNQISFDEKLNFGEDTKFVLDYLDCFIEEKLNQKINFVLEPLYIYHYGSPTSTVMSSSLMWSNWQKSYEDILAWIGHKPSQSEQKLLNGLYRRFKISHALAVARTSLSVKEQKKYVSLPFLMVAKAAVKLRY